MALVAADDPCRASCLSANTTVIAISRADYMAVGDDIPSLRQHSDPRLRASDARANISRDRRKIRKTESFATASSAADHLFRRDIDDAFAACEAIW